MSSVLHPTGPEGPQTYWLRRIGVVVAALVVVLVVAWAWPGGGGSNEAAPASDPSSVSPPAADTTPTSTPTASGTATPTAGASTTSSSAASSSSTTSASGTASKGDKKATSGTKSKDDKSKKGKGSNKEKAGPSTSTAPAVRDCKADEMHVTLTGTRSVTIGKTTKLKLSVINGSDDTCRLSLDAKTFELRIYSGSDRIWSTHDCKDWMKPIKKRTLKSQQEVDWSQAWPAKRSYEGCKLVDDLRPGTYVATAQLALHGDKAAPVQLVMSLHR